MTLRFLLLTAVVAATASAQRHTAGYDWSLEECVGTKSTREVVCKIDISSTKVADHSFDVYRNHRVLIDVKRGSPLPSTANWIERGKGERESKVISEPGTGFFYFVKFRRVPVVPEATIRFPRKSFNARINWQ